MTENHPGHHGCPTLLPVNQFLIVVAAINGHVQRYFLYPFTLAANFKGPGTGRGVLGGSMGPVSSATQSPGRSRAIETAPPAGRGRGRGLLLLDDDSD